MKKNATKVLASFSVMLVPALAFAQGLVTDCGQKSIQGYLCEIYKILGTYVVPMLSLAATGFFMWGIVMFIKNANNDKLRQEYKAYMTWGILALFVMVSVWGIIAIMGNIVGTDTSVIPQIKYK